MATRRDKGGPSAPPAIIASAILALPRDALADLVTLAIDRLDEIDGDPDLDASVEDSPEGFDPEEDMCLAGDDRVHGGSCTGASLLYEDEGPGDTADAEPDGRELRAPYTRKTRERACCPRRSRYSDRIEGFDFIAEPSAPTRHQILRKRGMPRRPRA